MRLIFSAARLIALGLMSFGLAMSADVRAEELLFQAPVIAASVPVPAPAPLVLTPELVAAHYDYRLARLNWQKYRFAELPRQRRMLDHEISQRQAEIRLLQGRVRDYRPFLQVGQYSPVRIDAENTNHALRTTVQELRQLKDDRINLMRYNRQNNQIYQLEVLRAALRVRQELAVAQKMSEQK